MIKEKWINLSTKARAGFVFAGVIISFALVYLVGGAILANSWPASSNYHVARVTAFDATDVGVKKETDSWHVAETPAYNRTKEELSVGQKVAVRQYWWFGKHTIVTEVLGR